MERYRERNRREEPREETEVNENLHVGRNAVKELLSTGRDVDKIMVAKGDREGSISMLVSKALERKIPVIEVDRKKLDLLTAGARHQGIIAYSAVQEYVSVDDILEKAKEKSKAPFVVVADNIEDPHNLGAIIRSAECSGADGLIIPKRRSVGLTAVVSKTSAGAVEHLPVCRVTNISQTLEELKEKGLWIYGADMDGDAYETVDMKGPCALVLGNEGFGLSRLVREHCDFIVSIPMYGKVNSMNVSAAASVLFCEVARQRNRTE